MLKAALALFVLLLASAGTPHAQEPSAAEAVVRDFAERMADGDFDGAASLIAIETGEEPDFAALATATGTLGFDRHIPAPGYSALLREGMRNSALKSVRLFVCALLLKDSFAPVAGMRSFMFHTGTREELEAKLDKFNDALNPARLKNLRPVRLDRLNPEDFDAAENLTDYAEFLVLYELDGARYAGSATMLRLADGWHMTGLLSLLAVERFKASERFKNAQTLLPETTLEEYEVLLNE